MYAAETFVFCFPDQHNISLADSKIESARLLLLIMYAHSKTFVANVRADTTFVVATSQSQCVALLRSLTAAAAVTYAINYNGGMAE